MDIGKNNILQGMKAVIFDMDGLLLDSETAWWKANEKFLGDRGQSYTTELSEKVIGSGHRETMQLYKDLFGFDEDIDSLAQKRQEMMYEILFEDISFLKGAVPLINELAKRGYPLAIATGGHSVMKAQELLEYVDVADKFSIIVTSEELSRGKPYPDIYLHTAEKLSVMPEECLVLEDSVQGVIAGVAAGMRVIGVNQREKSRLALKNAHAYLVVASLLEVLQIL